MRLIDLRCNWLRQYFSEMTTFDRSTDADVADRLGSLDGYLSDTSAACLTCSRAPADWAVLPDPWEMLGDMIARYQAEFSGRILMGPDDAERWRREPADGLCWGLIGVEGFDFLIRAPADLDRLTGIFERGVRGFQPIETSQTQIGGSVAAGDDRGLTDLGRLFLERLMELAPSRAPSSPRPILDLAGMNPATIADVLSWLEADSSRVDRILLSVSHGAIAYPGSLADPASSLSVEIASRIRTLGGVIGLSVASPCIASADDLAGQIRSLEAIPFKDGANVTGIAIGTDFLGGGDPLPGLKNAGAIIKWLRRTFDEATSRALMFGNARDLLRKAVGGER